MAFLDFIKNRDVQRPAAEQQSQQSRDETYKQKMTREVGEDKASAKPITHLPKEHQTRVDAVKAEMEKVSQQSPVNQTAVTQPPPDSTDNQQPMRQPMVNQDKPAPNLSPTTAQAGVTMKDVKGPSSPAETPSPSQQTIARRPPSWER